MSAGVTTDAGYVGRSSTWSPSPSTVTDWLPCLTESITQDITLATSEAIGQVSQYPGELVRIVAPGDVNCELDYNYGASVLEYALGAHSAGTYDTADQLSFIGFEFDKGVARVRHPSCVIDTMTISGAPDEVIRVSYGVVAYEELRSAVAFPSIRPAQSLQERVLFEDLNVRLGITGSALSASEDIGVSGFELTLNNTMWLDGMDSESAKRIMSPERNGIRTATLRLDFARFTSGLHTGGTHPINDWRDDQDELQASLVFTGSTGSYTINCPIAQIPSGANANIGGPEVIPDSITLRLNGGVNSDMAGADQLQIVHT
ncbi:MAG: phage tail tube protein [Solirubrobacterales bacterium]